MQISVPDQIISLEPINTFTNSKSGLSGIMPPSGADLDGMPAAQEMLALFTAFQSVLSEYAELIGYDGSRMQKIVEGFIRSDS